MTTEPLSRMRMTIDSPWTLGSVTTRRSTGWPSIVRPTRPSCGTRRSAMSRSDMIFTRLMTPATMRLRDRRRLDEHAVDAEAHAQLGALGLEVDVRGALLDRLGDDLVDELDDRRSSADSRRSTISAGPPSLEVLVERRSDSTTSSRRVMRLMSAGDVLAAGDRGADLEARHDRDVVDRQDVGGVGHRDEQRALVDVGDRDGLVALGGGGAEEVGGGHVDRELRQVEVVEAVALGDGAGELVLGDRALLEQDLLGRSRRCARACSIAGRRASRLDEARARRARRSGAAGAAAAGRRRDAVPLDGPARSCRPAEDAWACPRSVASSSADGSRSLGRTAVRLGAWRRAAPAARPPLEAQRALPDEDLEPVDDAAPASRARRLERGPAVAVDQVDDDRVRTAHRGDRQACPASSSPTRVQLTSIVGGLAARRRPRRRGPPRARACGCEHPHLRARLLAAPRPRRAPSRRRRGRARRRERRRSPRARPGRVGVVGVDAPSSPNVSVFAAPISRAPRRSRRRRGRAPPPCAGS